MQLWKNILDFQGKTVPPQDGACTSQNSGSAYMIKSNLVRYFARLLTWTLATTLLGICSYGVFFGGAEGKVILYFNHFNEGVLEVILFGVIVWLGFEVLCFDTKKDFDKWKLRYVSKEGMRA